MTLLGPLATPLRALAFTLGGAGLAWLWFNVGWWVPTLIVVGAWVLTVATQRYAERQITKSPLTALRLMELRLLGIVVVSAGAAAIVIVLAVAFTLTDEEKKAMATADQEVLSAVGAALAAFIGAVAISAENADEHIGKLIKDAFRRKFVTDSPAAAGQAQIRTDSDAGVKADRALNSSHDYGWSDWSKETRRLRVEAIDAYLKSST